MGEHLLVVIKFVLCILHIGAHGFLFFVDLFVMPSDGYIRKHKGYAGENRVRDWYEDQGYACVAQNFTIRGGEIDLVMCDAQGVTVFVEVKVVDSIDDVSGIITVKKRFALQRAIRRYQQKVGIDGDMRVDLVFLAKGCMIAHLENVFLWS